MGLVLLLAAFGVCCIAGTAAAIDWRRNARRSVAFLREDPHPPQREHFLALALFIMAISIYRSAVPFEFRPASVTSASEKFQALPVGEPDAPVEPYEKTIWNTFYYATFESSDYLANFLMGLPWGFLGMAAFAVDRRGKAVWIVAACLLAFSLPLRFLLEFSQYWIYLRHPSLQDVVADALGILCGIAAWIAAGQTITDWIRSKTISCRPARWFDWLLLAYVAGLLVAQIMPLEVTLRGADVARKFRGGGIELIPFSRIEWTWSNAATLAGGTLLYVPLGLLAATGMTSATRPVRTLGSSLVVGALLVLGLETTQIFVMNRSASTTDLLAGAVGMTLGVAAVRFFTKHHTFDDETIAHSLGLRETWPYAAGAIGYSLVLIIFKCAPYDPIGNSELIRRRFMAAFTNPFVTIWTNPARVTLIDLVEQGIWYVPLGVLLARIATGHAVPQPMRKVLLVALLAVPAGVAFTVEMFQVYLPPNVATMKDVVIAVLGAAFGMLITLWFTRPAARPLRARTSE